MWEGIDKKTKELFTSEDTVFHYTSVYTALEHILDKQQLRLSPRKQSNDPLENLRLQINHNLFKDYPSKNPNVSKKIKLEKIKLAKELSLDLLNEPKQLCFCINKPEEFLGFIKPRMWDQYADNYKGVVLAFSLKELKKNKLDTSDLLNNEINYKKYDSIRKDLDINSYDNSSEYANALKEQFFTKHVDYKDENEYRFLTFSKDEYHYLNISKSIKGIVISVNYTSIFAIKSLEKFAKDYGIEILYINWSSDGITLLNLK